MIGLKFKSSLIGLSVVLVSTALSSIFINSVVYEPNLPQQYVRQDNVIKMFEIVTSGNSDAKMRLGEIATPNTIPKLSNICSTSNTRVPEPNIWTFSVDGNMIDVVFDSNLNEKKNQLYRYTMEFSQSNKIDNLTTTFLYEGDRYED